MNSIEPVYSFDDAVTSTITLGDQSTWSQNAVYTISNGTSSGLYGSVDYSNNRTLKVAGDAEISGELTVGGKNLSIVLEKIEEHLAILHPNPALEEKYETLRDLRKQYMELEAQLKEKEEIADILRK
jgi:hypothetical protein